VPARRFRGFSRMQPDAGRGPVGEFKALRIASGSAPCAQIADSTEVPAGEKSETISS
jgi:hypothetical protein